MTRKRILLVDTLNSAYYLKHSNDTNVVWRFLNDIRDLAARFKIDRVIFAYEGGGSVYRNRLYPEYKWKRKADREKASAQEKASLKTFFKSYDLLLEHAPKFGIKTVNVKGAEADDTIAFLINNIDLNKYAIMLLSSDTDLHQLLRPGVVQGTYGKDMAHGLARNSIPAGLFLNYDTYCKEQEILPTDYALAKSLSGDTADSIKGFEGVGPKTALALIKKYKSFKNIEGSLGTLSVPRLAKKSIDHMYEDFGLVHRNYQLINLNWSREKFSEILGDDGVEKLVNFISEIDTPEFVDRKEVTELCYEYGRIDIIEQLEFWLHAFGGKL